MPRPWFNWLIPHTRRRAIERGLVEDAFDVPPHGRVLHLRRPSGTAVLERNAVANKLRPFVDGRMPYAAILVDLGGSDYHFSSPDLGCICGSIAAWVRGWVAPCAIVLTERSALELQRVLELIGMGKIGELRLVDSEDAGRRHIAACLDRRAV
jgi:hypothetical protein